MRFRDRVDAGLALARAVEALALPDPIVLGLPRGGVPVAFEVAAHLDAPLDVFVTRKVGAPRQPEYAVGAIAEGGTLLADDHALRALRIDDLAFRALVHRELDELSRRVRHYRGQRPPPAVAGREVVLVDDGLATGLTAEAALLTLRALGPARLVLAVPVGAPASRARLADACDEVVCVLSPSEFRSVGEWYDQFEQTTDAEVLDLLARSRFGEKR